MVAVIAGTGLGLGNSSLKQLGMGLGGQAGIGQAGVAQYLNAATGNLLLQNADENLIFDGLSLNSLRTYNSQGQLSGNDGWQFGFSRSVGGLTGTVNTAGSTVTRTDDDGSTTTYAYSATRGLYVSTNQSGAQDTLAWNATTSTWGYTDSATRQQEAYNTTGQLTSVSDPETGARYAFTYSGGQLSTVVSGDGDTLMFGYNTSQQLISLSIQEIPPGQTTAVTRQQVGYQYDSQGRLQTVTTTLASDTDASPSTASYTTTYGYDGTSDRVASITQSDGTAVHYSYTANAQNVYQVTGITTGTGSDAQTLTLAYSAGSTTLTNALGQTWAYTYNAANQLTQVTAPVVNGSAPTTTYQYDSHGNLLQSTDATGATTSYSYDPNGNLLSVEDATGHTVSYTYNADDQLLTQTTYTVPAQGTVGQSGYVAPSGAQTTYHVYDASDRLSYVIDPLGDVTAYTYSTIQGITVLSSTQQYRGTTYSLTGLSPSTPPTLAALQAWVATSAVKATLPQSSRTDYTYDVRGQLSTQTQWDTVDANGNGVSDAGTSITTTVYDAQGRLLQTITERGASRTTLETTSYAYDGLGRLIGTTDALGHVTSYLYTDASNTLTITQANGLTTTQVRNTAGLLISSTQSASGQSSRTTTMRYNSAGEAVASFDTAGNATYTFYDADGRVSGTVDALGYVTAFGYDADGRVIATTQYATAVSTSGWASGTAPTANLPTTLPIPSSNACDRTSHVIFDAVGRAVASIDAVGAVTTRAYDGDGEAIGTKAYATALTSAQLSSLGAAPTWAALQADLTANAADRTTHTLYDADQRPVAVIDGGGYVTVTRYDTQGHVVQTIAYATALTASQLSALGATPTLAALQAALTTSNADQSTRTYYDAAGRLVAQVDADGYLTTTAYDETAHTTTVQRYATALSGSQLSALTGSESVSALVALLGSASTSQQSSTTYNADNQRISATAVDGTVTAYTYDTVGHLLTTTVTPGAGQGIARTAATAYDAFGDVIGTLDGVGAAHLTAGMTPAQQAAVFSQYGTTYSYNALGQRTQSTDPVGNSTWYYYDADGRLSYAIQGQLAGSTRNALGDVVAYGYSAFGQVTTTTVYAGALTLSTSGASSGVTLNTGTATTAQVATALASLATVAADPTSVTTTNYTNDGQVATVTDGNGYASTRTYDAFGDLIQLQQQLSGAGSALSASNSTLGIYGYDSRGERITQTDASGTAVAQTTQRTYDAFGRLTSATDGDGHTITYGYDNLGRQVSSSQTVGGTARTTQTTYDAFGRTLAQIDALGNATVYQYDLANHKVTVTTPDNRQITTTRDAYGDTVAVTDGLGNVTRNTYDQDGRLLTTVDALGNTILSHQYDADGHLTQTTDGTGHVVTMTYDASGRVLTRIVDPSGLALTTTYAYDGEGRQLSVTDPTGVVTTLAYDADGNVLTQVQDAGDSTHLNLTTTYTYDGEGQSLTVTVGAGTAAARTTQYVYDNRERLSQQIVDPSGLHLTTTYGYDAASNLISVTDGNGYVTRYVYDEANEKVFTVDPTGAVTQTWYDADGRVTQTRGYVTSLTAGQLSALGSAPTAAQLAALVAPTTVDSFHQMAYNAEGQMVYAIDGVGLHSTQYTYDAAGRLVATTRYANALSSAPTGTSPSVAAVAALVVPSSGDQTTLTTYDADGQARFTVQTNTVNGQLVGIVSEQRYDAAGRVVATLAYGQTIALSTAQSLVSQVSTSSLSQTLASAPNEITRNVYDNAGRLRYVIDTTAHVTQTQYDNDGRVTDTLVYPNPITLPNPLTVASVAAAVAAAGTTGARFNSTVYDAAGRVSTTSDALGINATYTYDATGLQTGHADRDGNWTYDLYDKAGRKTLEQTPPVNVGSWSANNTFQQGTAYLYTTYTYDGVGNVKTVSQGSGPDAAHVTVLSTTTYNYDGANHQVQTIYPGGVSTHVVYNALGQAVVDQDANGNDQYKAYISLGWPAYSVDADGYVTGNSYDAFGNITSVTRYATPLNTAAITGWTAGQPLTVAQIQQGLVTSAADRTITTTYDQRNEKIQVQQSAMAYDLAMGPSAGTAMAAAQPTTHYTYDAYGNQTSVAVLMQAANATGDANATPAIWATTYTYYDALNRAVMTVAPAGSYTNPQGAVTTTTYNAFGDVASTDQYATLIVGGNLSPATPPSVPAASVFDRTSTYGYDSIGRKNAQTDTGAYSTYVGLAAQTSTTQITYDGENRVKTLTVNGQTTTTNYDALGRVVGVISPAYQALVANWQSVLQSTPGDDLTTAALYTTTTPYTYYIYDAKGNVLVTTVTNTQNTAAEQTWAWYDARGNQIQVQDANGNQTFKSYDNNGNMTGQTATLTNNGTSTTVTTTYGYDRDNQQNLTYVQRAGQSGYDSYTQVKYNAFGEVIAKGDNNGFEANYTYDTNGNLSSAPDPKTGAIHTYGYDLAGHLVLDYSLVTGSTTTQTWTHNWLDLAGRVVEQRTPSDSAASGVNTSIQTLIGYDRWGNVTTLTDAAGNTTQSLYDAQNHLVQQTEARVLVVSATGARTFSTPTKTWYYDTSGQLDGVVDENGNTTWTNHDALGRVVQVMDATGAKTYTAYDALGRAVAQQTPPANTATGPVVRITYTSYDNLNQVVAQGDFQLNAAGTGRTQQAQETYVLNSNGDRLTVTDALGNTSYYSYDSQHRVLSSQTPVQHASNVSDTVTYDANGNKTSDTDANGNRQSWVYDYFGRVQSHVDLSGATTNYTYDAGSGLLTTVTSNWAPAGQGNPGYLPGILTGTGSSEQYQYYADGQVAKLTQITGSSVAQWDTYQYDVNGNQTVDATYTTDGAGLVVHTETVSSYDSHNRLSVETTENPDNSVANSREVINYDAVGNRRAVFVQSAYGPTASPISGSGGAPTGSVGAQTATPGQPWSFNVAAGFTDNVGFGLTYTATGMPGWMSLNSNGTFSGSPSTAGSWSVTVTATDVNGQSVSSTFTVTVPTVAPVFTAAASNQTVAYGAPFSFTVPGATDANGLAISYSPAWVTSSGWVPLPTWVVFNASTRTFSGTPPSGTSGTYTFVYGAAAGGFNPTQSFTLTVSPTPPVYNGGVGNQTVFNGRAFSFSYPASAFNESDGDALTFTAGTYAMSGSTETDSALPSWMSFNASTLTFSGTPPASAVGQTFTLYLTGKNPQGQIAEAHFTVGVSQYVQPAPVYNGGLANQTGVIGGGSLNLTLPANAFNEPDGGALTYTGMVLIPAHTLTINKGGEPIDTKVAAQWVALSNVGLSVNATTGAITGVPTTLTYETSTFSGPVYAHDTAYQIEVVATNAQGGSAAGAFTLTNSYSPPVVTGSIPAQTITPNGSPQIYDIPAVFSDPYGHGLTFSSNAPAWAGFASNGSFTFNGTSEPVGTYNWTITATDGLGHTNSTTIAVSVNNAAPVFNGPVNNITAVQGMPFSYQVPGARDYNGDTLSYSGIMWNGSAYVALPSWVTFNASTLTFSGTPPTNGSFIFGCWAFDTHGAISGEGFTLTVAAGQQPPQYVGTLQGADFEYVSPKPISINASGQFTDPQGQALTYTATQSNGSALPAWLVFNASTQTFSGNPNLHNDSYLTWTIQLTATDSGGRSSSITFTLGYQGPAGTQVVKAQTAAVQAQTTQATTPNIQAEWFTYDADNRVLVNNGGLVNGQIVVTGGTYDAPSYANQYDAAGNVAIRNTVVGTAYQQTVGPNTINYGAGDQVSQQLVYDTRNELVKSDYAVDTTIGQSYLGVQTENWYDADGHQIGSNNYLASNAQESVYGLPDKPNGYMYVPIGGWLTNGTATSYNADGQVNEQVSWQAPARNWTQIGQNYFDGNGTLPDGGQNAVPTLSSDGPDVVASTTTYTAFDHADNVTAYSYTQAAPSGTFTNGFGANYTVNYLKKDGYLEQSTTGTAPVAGYVPATDTS